MQCESSSRHQLVSSSSSLSVQFVFTANHQFGVHLWRQTVRQDLCHLDKEPSVLAWGMLIRKPCQFVWSTSDSTRMMKCTRLMEPRSASLNL